MARGVLIITIVLSLLLQSFGGLGPSVTSSESLQPSAIMGGDNHGPSSEVPISLPDPLGPALPGEEAIWELIYGSINGRSYHAMAYDSGNDRLVVFGGTDGLTNNDVWEFDPGNRTWEGPFLPALRPSARQYPSLSYDSESEVLVMFGGWDTARDDETWEYDVATHIWTGPFLPALRPSPRSDHRTTYDNITDRVILFGGSDGSARDDVWEYDANNHTWEGPFMPALRPESRRHHGIAFDTVNGRSVVYGGWNTSDLNDTWEYDSLTHTWAGPFTPSPSPGVRWLHSMAFDASVGKVIMFGGQDFTTKMDDTWHYDAATHTWDGAYLPTPKPSARSSPTLAYDSLRGKTLLMGGYDGHYLDDVWEYDGNGSWAGPFTEALSPTARVYHSMAYDSRRGHAVIYGGYDGAYLNSTWEYDSADDLWSGPYTSALLPTATRYVALAYDSKHDRVVLFGGWDGTYYNETWEYDPSTHNWSGPYMPSLRPSGRSYAAMDYDPVRDRIVMFGGYTPALNDETWEYDVGNHTWAGPIEPIPRPSGRRYHEMVYDSAKERLIMFGGYDGTYSDEIWEYDGANQTWEGPITPATRPIGRMNFDMAYDSLREQVVVFGGQPGPVLWLSDTWLYDSSTQSWTGPLFPPVTPTGRSTHEMIYSNATDEVVMFGGYTSGYSLETWEFKWVNVSSIPVILGWNLISIPTVAQGEPLEVFDDSLGDGATSWDIMFRYRQGIPGSWESYSVTRPAYLNSLLDVNGSLGLWINISSTGDASLTIAGAPLTDLAVPLYSGWNLVGFPTQLTQTVSDALMAVSFGAILGFSAGADYLIDPMNGTDLMEPGHGYWIQMDSAGVWDPP